MNEFMRHYENITLTPFPGDAFYDCYFDRVTFDCSKLDGGELKIFGGHCENCKIATGDSSITFVFDGRMVQLEPRTVAELSSLVPQEVRLPNLSTISDASKSGADRDL